MKAHYVRTEILVAIVLVLLTAVALWTKPRPWVYDPKLVCDYAKCMRRN